MSCEAYDWKAYALGELAATERREAEAHAAGCEACRGELSQARMTMEALGSLHMEEVPRRIAFVSDKVFEPKWWETFPRPTFAAACVLAAAIVMHGYMTRPAPMDNAAIQARIDQAVGKAVAEVEQRNTEAVNVIDRKVTDFYVASTGIVRQ
jgi:anti-sigma factor RsiW